MTKTIYVVGSELHAEEIQDYTQLCMVVASLISGGRDFFVSFRQVSVDDAPDLFSDIPTREEVSNA